MMRAGFLTALGAAMLFWSGEAAAQNATHGCTCIENQTPITVHYDYKWGDNAWGAATLNAGNTTRYCWPYKNPNDQSSPPLRVRFKVNLTSEGSQTQEYVLERVKATNPQNCQAVAKAGQFVFRRANNNATLQMIKAP